MRTLRLTALLFLALTGLGLGTASAREIDDTYATTTLSARPLHTTTHARFDHNSKRDANVPAKYDVAFPVRERSPLLRHEGAI
jgi:hypothetical protein